MDYLIIEGYPTAAQKFAAEANIQPKISTEALEARVSIRQAILSGNIERAIERINDFNPAVRFAPSHQFHPSLCYDYTSFHAPLIASALMNKLSTLQSSE
jgi:hypothetical protein